MKQVDYIACDFGIAGGEQAEVGVESGRTHMIVARANVDVAAKGAVLSTSPGARALG
jgi:hypothetical protein